MNREIKVFRASFLHCLNTPNKEKETSFEYIEDGLLIVENGLIKSLTEYNEENIPVGCKIQDLTGKIIVPGFIDTHVHYPQVDIIASYGTQLLEWLETYTFPLETKFENEQLATETAEFFLNELISNGTTTALVFATVHKISVSSFFKVAKKMKMRMICGKVMMDRNAPTELLDTPEQSYFDSLELIKEFHNVDRLSYAVTPRFAPTSSKEQLKEAGKLLKLQKNLFFQTHLSENVDECNWVKKLFPENEDYFQVYEQLGLVRKRSVFAHAIHLSESEWKRIGLQKAAVSHCPTSNLFIGSGLFDLEAAKRNDVTVGLGTDVGGGDSFSMLRTINEAYKIQQLQKVSLDPLEAFYMATLGGAKALDLDDKIGNFVVGKEADFVALDPKATPLLKRRTNANEDWKSTLFAIMMLGDDRSIYDTFILGNSVKLKQKKKS